MEKKPRAQTDVILKTLASDTSSREILNFLKEDSQRQAARDYAFLQLMGALVTQSNPNVVSPITYPMQDTRSQLPTQSNPAVVSPMTYPIQDTRSQYRYGMTDSRPNAQEFNGYQNQNNFSFFQQLNNQDLP